MSWPTEPPTAGLDLIEMHSHLIPSVDDGSRTMAESVTIAETLVYHGYSRLVCTPHIWPNLPENTIPNIVKKVRELQATLDEIEIPLKLYAGGEINLRPELASTHPDKLPSYGMTGKFLLVDAWLSEWPDWLTPVLKNLQSGGRTVILAHPERLSMIQDDYDNAGRFRDMGVLLQGNLYCFVDDRGESTRETADRLLEDEMYFMLAGDLHREDTMNSRITGLTRITERLGLDGVRKLLRDNPATLLS